MNLPCGYHVENSRCISGRDAYTRGQIYMQGITIPLYIVFTPRGLGSLSTTHDGHNGVVHCVHVPVGMGCVLSALFSLASELTQWCVLCNPSGLGVKLLRFLGSPRDVCMASTAAFLRKSNTRAEGTSRFRVSVDSKV